MNEVLVCSLASGSNGNIYYIEADGVAIVVDMGISFKNLTTRAGSRHVDLSKIRAVFVSHEHSDHVYGLSSLCRRTGALAFMTKGTYDGMRPKYRPADASIRIFTIGRVIEAGPFLIHSFAKPHDVKEPCSFRVEANGVSIGVFTDIGKACPGLSEHLALSHLAFIESNYDLDMLNNGKYSPVLKRRIKSGFGHLSNVEAASVVRDVQSQTLHSLFLSHISADNNTPEIARQAFADLADKYRIEVMSRHEASDIWRVTTSSAEKLPVIFDIPVRIDRIPNLVI